MFEMNELSKEIAYQALRAASYKLPIKCKIIDKNEAE